MTSFASVPGTECADAHESGGGAALIAKHDVNDSSVCLRILRTESTHKSRRRLYARLNSRSLESLSCWLLRSSQAVSFASLRIVSKSIFLAPIFGNQMSAPIRPPGVLPHFITHLTPPPRPGPCPGSSPARSPLHSPFLSSFLLPPILCLFSLLTDHRCLLLSFLFLTRAPFLTLIPIIRHSFCSFLFLCGDSF